MSNYVIAKDAVVSAALFTKNAVVDVTVASTQETLVGLAYTAIGVAVAADFTSDKAKVVLAHADKHMGKIADKLEYFNNKLAARYAKLQPKVVDNSASDVDALQRSIFLNHVRELARGHRRTA